MLLLAVLRLLSFQLIVPMRWRDYVPIHLSLEEPLALMAEEGGRSPPLVRYPHPADDPHCEQMGSTDWTQGTDVKNKERYTLGRSH